MTVYTYKVQMPISFWKDGDPRGLEFADKQKAIAFLENRLRERGIKPKQREEGDRTVLFDKCAVVKQ